jgi:glycosyltransferase involved in cell wall biosynthesis
VYHGLPDDLYRFHPEPGRYLAFLGRICPEKGVDRAIAIAKGIELKIAAKVDAADQEYFETEIRHLLDDPLVDFIGEIGDGEKEAFLGGAAALLMPIGRPEPVRTGRDRSHGLRHPRDRLSLRLHARVG